MANDWLSEGEGYVRFTAFGTHEKTEEALERIRRWKGM